MSETPATKTATGDTAHQGGHLAHVMPVPVLLAVFAALIVLTALTVAATWVDLGGLNLAIALGIATVKAALVALFFMHLLYDRPFNALAFCAGLLFVTLFLALTLLDTVQYQPEIQSRQESQESGLP